MRRGRAQTSQRCRYTARRWARRCRRRGRRSRALGRGVAQEACACAEPRLSCAPAPSASVKTTCYHSLRYGCRRPPPRRARTSDGRAGATDGDVLYTGHRTHGGAPRVTRICWSDGLRARREMDRAGSGWWRAEGELGGRRRRALRSGLTRDELEVQPEVVVGPRSTFEGAFPAAPPLLSGPAAPSASRARRRVHVSGRVRAVGGAARLKVSAAARARGVPTARPDGGRRACFHIGSSGVRAPWAGGH